MKTKLHNFKLIIATLLVCTTYTSYAQTNTWTGDTNTDFYNSLNWSDETIDFSGDITTKTLIIGAGSPNDPIQVGGSNHTTKRPAFLNTETGCNLTFNGTLYPGDTQYWRGTITVNDGADINIRNVMYLGKEGSGTLNITGGSFTVKNYSIIGSGINGVGEVNLSGGTFASTLDMQIASDPDAISGTLNITGGNASVTRNLTIGTNGHIYITSPGSLSITGNQTTLLNGYISSGKIVATAGALQVVYDGTKTTVSVDPTTLSIEKNVTLKQVKVYPNPTNGEFTIDLPNAQNLLSVELYNINGGLISSQNYMNPTQKLKLNISEVPTGIYFLKILTDTPQTFKIVKQN
ncbi:T9SS type A sorting domain-containing protein [Mariniflexile sp. HNIBRBA6329]|uniref:T9SS type A sorting domain-containing protein n=1 Tax=Mariniflexile sp. HNIBRBA6329 TaxID=3373088 RepID=UPI0037469C03